MFFKGVFKKDNLLVLNYDLEMYEEYNWFEVWYKFIYLWYYKRCK